MPYPVAPSPTTPGATASHNCRLCLLLHRHPPLPPLLFQHQRLLRPLYLLRRTSLESGEASAAGTGNSIHLQTLQWISRAMSTSPTTIIIAFRSSRLQGTSWTNGAVMEQL